MLKEVFEELDPDDQGGLEQGLHIGRVINEYQESFHAVTFWSGTSWGPTMRGIAINDLIKVGQTSVSRPRRRLGGRGSPHPA